MSEIWIRRSPERRDDLVAGLVAAGTALLAGGVGFWLARLLLARERVPARPRPDDAPEALPAGEEPR